MLPLFLGTLGLPELLVIGGIVVLIVGGKKFAQLGKGLGQGIFNFRKGLKSPDGEEEDEDF